MDDMLDRATHWQSYGDQQFTRYLVEDLVAEITRLSTALEEARQENARLLGPTGQICPQDGGVCWDRCASNFCALAAARAQLETAERERDEARQEREKAGAFLEREGYRRCDIAACNCGSWHKQ